jgi:hypothetical protein
MAGLSESIQEGLAFLAMGCGESSQEIPATWNDPRGNGPTGGVV